MKKLTALIGTALMFASLSTYAGCPTQQQCNAISDSYGRAMCLQAASAPSCTTTQPPVVTPPVVTPPVVTPPVVTPPATCTIQPSNATCSAITDSYGRSKCFAAQVCR